MSQLTQQISFHLLTLALPSPFPNAIFQNKPKNRVMETQPVAERNKWSTTGIHRAIVFPCSHKPQFTCERSIKFPLVCGSRLFLHHLFILPNLINDTGYRYRPQLPGLSQSRLVTPSHAWHTLFRCLPVPLCLLLLLASGPVRFWIGVAKKNSVHELVPFDNMALNGFICFNKKKKNLKKEAQPLQEVSTCQGRSAENVRTRWGFDKKGPPLHRCATNDRSHRTAAMQLMRYSTWKVCCGTALLSSCRGGQKESVVSLPVSCARVSCCSWPRFLPAQPGGFTAQ